MSQIWDKELSNLLNRLDIQKIFTRIEEERLSGYSIFPAADKILNAFELTPFEKIKVVIIGQDPYHQAGQAHGLSFSVPTGIKIPPSLRNIYKEIERSTGNAMDHDNGNLTPWAEQGVLLLNAVLTVRAGKPGSHAGIGWGAFTNKIIQMLSEQKNGLIFLLWGKFAQEKTKWIHSDKHHILTAPHPSPFSAHKGFLGCNHFVLTNELLIQQGDKPINWKI